MRALALGCFYSHISTGTFRRALTALVDSCAKIECPFSGVTKSGRIWRKVPENGAQSVTHTHTGAHIRNTTTTTHTLLTQPTYTHTPLLSPTRHTRTSLDLSTSLSPDQIATLVKKTKNFPTRTPIPSLLCVSRMKWSPLTALKYSHPGLQRTCSVHTSSEATQCLRPTPQ